MLIRSCRHAIIETCVSVRVKNVGNVISGVGNIVASDSEEYVSPGLLASPILVPLSGCQNPYL